MAVNNGRVPGWGSFVLIFLVGAASLLLLAWAFRGACVNGQQELPIDGHEISPLADTRTPRRRTGFLPSGRSSDQRLHPLPGESLF